MTQPVEEIFHLYKPLLPDGWKWCTVFYVAGGGRRAESTGYGYTSNREDEEVDFDSPTGMSTKICNLMGEFIDTLAPAPLQQPTHIELTIEPDGKFETVLGYGEPNWDPAPRAWPDDITAESYTYTKAWPDGISDEIKEILDDPRSLIGYD